MIIIVVVNRFNVSLVIMMFIVSVTKECIVVSRVCTSIRSYVVELKRPYQIRKQWMLLVGDCGPAKTNGVQIDRQANVETVRSQRDELSNIVA